MDWRISRSANEIGESKTPSEHCLVEAKNWAMSFMIGLGGNRKELLATGHARKKNKNKKKHPSSDTNAGSRTTSSEAEIGLRDPGALHKKLATLILLLSF